MAKSVPQRRDAVRTSTGEAAMNSLRQLQDFGQSIWLDSIRRSLITSGELRQLVVEDGLVGVTSNPAIFEKAIVGRPGYKDALETLYRQTALRAISLLS